MGEDRRETVRREAEREVKKIEMPYVCILIPYSELFIMYHKHILKRKFHLSPAAQSDLRVPLP